MPISSDHDTDSTEELYSECDSEHDFDVYIPMKDDLDTLHGIHSDGNVHMERD